MRPGRQVKVRRLWAIRPATRVIPDQTKRPWRRRKHKQRPGED